MICDYCKKKERNENINACLSCKFDESLVDNFEPKAIKFPASEEDITKFIKEITGDSNLALEKKIAILCELNRGGD